MKPKPRLMSQSSRGVIPPCFSNISPKSVLPGVTEVLCRVMEHLDVLSAQLLCALELTVLFAWNLLYLPLPPIFPPADLSIFLSPSEPITLIMKFPLVLSAGYHVSLGLHE